jgi:hypothetical protein
VVVKPSLWNSWAYHVQPSFRFVFRSVENTKKSRNRGKKCIAVAAPRNLRESTATRLLRRRGGKGRRRGCCVAVRDGARESAKRVLMRRRAKRVLLRRRRGFQERRRVGRKGLRRGCCVAARSGARGSAKRLFVRRRRGEEEMRRRRGCYVCAHGGARGGAKRGGGGALWRVARLQLIGLLLGNAPVP